MNTSSDSVKFEKGVFSVIEPVIRQLDDQVQSTKESQIALNTKIDLLAEFLNELDRDPTIHLDSYSRKLDDSKRRVSYTAKILENVHDRLGKLQRDIAREAHSKKQLITAIPPAPPAQ